MLRTGLLFDPFSASRLITAAALSPFPSLDHAQQVFDQIPHPNLYAWNTLIRAYASSSNPHQSLLIFIRMLHQSPDFPDKFTFPFLIKALLLGSDVFIPNSLIHFYAKCGELGLGYRVFVKMPRRDVVSWNSMITAFVQGGCPEEALELFREMETQNVKPNGITMVGVLSACAKKSDFEFGRWVHSYIERNRIGESLTLSNAILDMYTSVSEKDIVSWTTMLVGYAKIGEYDAAQGIFDTMPNQDIAAWNALISAYEQCGKPKEALKLFHELQLSKTAKPDEVTLVSTLSACAQLGAMDLGNLQKALVVFHSVERKDVFVWSAMIAGLAMHGHGKDAINLFSKMQEAKVKPNAVTFTNILCACSHAGLVEEGRTLFNQMELVYGVLPGIKHYACMVDILEKMPMAPAASVWGALLGACTIHENVELAEQACSQLLELEPGNHGAYVLLSNIYAKAGKWDRVSGLRKLMRDVGLKKEPGCSSIEVDGIVHEFLVGDNSHPSSKKIHAKLDEIAARLETIGYVPNKSHLLQLVEEEDVKEQALFLHSEKLAIAFGLISTCQSQPIRIVKNLRVCGDCHSVAKLVSKLYDREILLRDPYRFHHFREGHCSCMDYW
ncbi:hypothetical protein PVL29_007624 [Vitis rotundifolia]|uniref:DYW domain-containing protein n=1 Tax=Vitis rotundifolia TaxID=103349 RepID=A0AA39DWH1_VITRO|nr:hypothetical protein PVL29_007624 [Vitis rotundifolia]